MLTRFDPFKDVDRLFDEFHRGSRQVTAMALDIARGPDRYVVEADLPGVDPDSIELSVEGNVLTVTAERRASAVSDLQVIASERSTGRFTRQLTIGEGFDMEKVSADYVNGVLTVTLPVAEAAKPKRIKVNAGERQSIDASSG